MPDQSSDPPSESPIEAPGTPPPSDPDPPPDDGVSYHPCGIHPITTTGDHSLVACPTQNGQSCIYQSYYACSPHEHAYPDDGDDGDDPPSEDPPGEDPDPDPDPDPPTLVDCWRPACDALVSDPYEHRVDSCSNCGGTYWTCGPYLSYHTESFTCVRSGCGATYTQCQNVEGACSNPNFSKHKKPSADPDPDPPPADPIICAFLNTGLFFHLRARFRGARGVCARHPTEKSAFCVLNTCVSECNGTLQTLRWTHNTQHRKKRANFDRKTAFFAKFLTQITRAAKPLTHTQQPPKHANQDAPAEINDTSFSPPAFYRHAHPVFAMPGSTPRHRGAFVLSFMCGHLNLTFYMFCHKIEKNEKIRKNIKLRLFLFKGRYYA